MGWLIVLAAVTGYALLGIPIARHRYRHMRLLTVPNCGDDSRYHTHYERCYRQNKESLINSNREAAGYALVQSVVWPVLAVGIGLLWLVMHENDRPTGLELQGRIAELEHELGIGVPEPVPPKPAVRPVGVLAVAAHLLRPR